MHIKIIDPAKHGKVVYNNKSSSAKAVSYLEKGTEEEGQNGMFFNRKRDDILPEEVLKAIDNNTKGLKRNEVKFHSIIISPSEKELRHINNDQEKLKNYTIQVMKNYASNFRLREGLKIKEKNLVWFAIIHWNRKFKSIDFQKQDPLTNKEKTQIEKFQKELSGRINEKQRGNIEQSIYKIQQQACSRNQKRVEKGIVVPGMSKHGLNTHLHVIVSRRDAAMKITLNPQGRKSRFNIMQWQIKSGESFQEMFHYKDLTISENHGKMKVLSNKEIGRNKDRIFRKVEKINTFLTSEGGLDKNLILKIAEERNYDKGFFMNLNRVGAKIKEGKPLNDPYIMLQSNKDKQQPKLSLESQFMKIISDLENGDRTATEYTENLSGKRYGKRKSNKEKAVGQDNQIDM